MTKIYHKTVVILGKVTKNLSVTIGNFENWRADQDHLGGVFLESIPHPNPAFLGVGEKRNSWMGTHADTRRMSGGRVGTLGPCQP